MSQERLEDVRSLLASATKVGVGVLEFWDMTPAETITAMQGIAWFEDLRARRETTQAWLSAALGRAKRMPTLRALLPTKPRPMTAEEAERRGKEHEQLIERMSDGK